MSEQRGNHAQIFMTSQLNNAYCAYVQARVDEKPFDEIERLKEAWMKLERISAGLADESEQS